MEIFSDHGFACNLDTNSLRKKFDAVEEAVIPVIVGGRNPDCINGFLHCSCAGFVRHKDEDDQAHPIVCSHLNSSNKGSELKPKCKTPSHFNNVWIRPTFGLWLIVEDLPLGCPTWIALVDRALLCTKVELTDIESRLDQLDLEDGPYLHYPVPIPREKVGKALKLYLKFQREEWFCELSSRLAQPTISLIRSTSTSVGCNTVCATTEQQPRPAIGFDENESSLPINNSVKLMSSDDKKILRRNRLSPATKGKATLVRLLGSYSVYLARHLLRPLEHYDIEALLPPTPPSPPPLSSLPLPRKLYYPKLHVRTPYIPENEINENSKNPSPGESETIWNFPASHLSSSRPQQLYNTTCGDIYSSNEGYKTFTLKYASQLEYGRFPKGWNAEWGSLRIPSFHARIGKLFERDYVWVLTQTMVSFENLALWAVHNVLTYKVYPGFWGRILRTLHWLRF